jgi:sulfite reductase alpha subunit-like flavoprotein
MVPVTSCTSIDTTVPAVDITVPITTVPVEDTMVPVDTTVPVVDTAVPVWVSKGTISFPSSPDAYVIMIGPGTGCAPFRSYIEDRLARVNDGVCRLMLFFGSRSINADYFFKDEWERLADQGLLMLYTAFSRDQDDKIYVQHRIIEHGGTVWDWIDGHRAHVYIAG